MWNTILQPHTQVYTHTHTHTLGSFPDCVTWPGNENTHIRTYSVCHTLIVFMMLKPLRAVVMRTPGSWGCQWSSLISDWPWWMNSNCGGTSAPPSPSLLPPSLSCSTAKSHWTTWRLPWQHSITCIRHYRINSCTSYSPPVCSLTVYPSSYLVICSWGSKDCGVLRMPFHGCDWSRMVFE